MRRQNLQQKIQLHFPFSTTKDQEKLIIEIANFVETIDNNCIFILKGYAGTGKTTLISSLVKSLPIVGQRSILLAPTGRAAKVLAKYSQKKAYKINKKI